MSYHKINWKGSTYNTVGHDSYTKLTNGEVMTRFMEIGFEHNDYDLCMDIANMISHVRMGGEAKDACTGLNPEGMQEIAKTLTLCPRDFLKRGSPLQVASNFLQLVFEEEQKAKGDKGKGKGDDSEEGEEGEEEQGNGDGEEDGDGDGKGESEGDGKDPKEGKGKDKDKDKDKGEGEGEGKKAKAGSSLSKTMTKKRLQVIESIVEYERVREISVTHSAGACEILDYIKMPQSDIDFLNKLGILLTHGDLKTRRLTEKQEIQKMTQFSQITKLRSKVDMVMPTFQYRLANKDLRIRVKLPPSKQAICLMIDDSGSMNDPFKKEWVKAILWNRCMEASKNKLRLFVSLFEGELYGTREIKSLEEGIKFYEEIGFNGGGTDIQKSAMSLIEYFKKEKIQIQVVVINDGQDHVDPEWNPGVELHALMLKSGNENLQGVIKNSGGLFKVFN